MQQLTAYSNSNRESFFQGRIKKGQRERKRRKIGQKQEQGKMKAHQWLAWKSTGRVPDEHPLKEFLFSERSDEERGSCDDDFFGLPMILPCYNLFLFVLMLAQIYTNHV